jgi:crotonobetainyl-CoA:carnitine CoA-transferase CaiB-like acyl-CoA transferase
MSLPLSSLKVLDFSTLLPGPYATMLMADMGAEVLRVEALGRHDMLNDFIPKYQGNSYAFMTLNRNKQVIGLDLKKTQAIDIIKKLITEYDVVLEQFRPSVMAKFGLDYQSLKAINPKLIYCSITGFGQNGGYKNRAGHDINYLALSGLASYSGTQHSGPVLSGTQIADIAGGSHHAVMGILAAVIQRGINNQGQHLDISMTDSAFSLNGISGAGAVGSSDADPTLSGTLLNGGCFYGYYQTQDGRYLSVGSLEPKFAALFFETIGQSGWLARTTSQDKSQQQRLISDIGQVISEKPMNYWQSLFSTLDACVEPVLTVTEAADSSLMKERDMLVDVQVNSGEMVRQIAPAIKFSSQTKDTHAKNLMTFSERNDVYTHALLERLGYYNEIEQLINDKVIE